VFAYRRLTDGLTKHSGWQVVCAWQADLAAIFYLGGTIIQGMIVMNYPSYNFKRWHGTLLLYAVIVIGVAFNTVLARLLPWVEGTILITHCIGFIVVLVPLVYLGPHASASDVFAQYLTLGNYSPGLSFFVGLITTVFGFLGMPARAP
jgi:choline transport protein